MIAEPGTDTSPESNRACALSGFADLHMHLNAHLAHGGRVFSGLPAPINAQGAFELSVAYNVNTALSWQDDSDRHGLHGLGDVVGLGTRDPALSAFGAPYFSNWPRWNSTTHQQVYYKWLERAWQGGLRLMVQFAVTNEALCKATTNGAGCDDSMTPINRQLDATWDFQRFIDEQCQLGQTSCVNGQGWFRIVTSPYEARQVIARGQMAVVLGIEVDNLFNCKEGRPCPDELYKDDGEPIESIAEAVDYYYGKGVRHVFPVHNFDNAFGAAATWQDGINAGNRYSEGRWWDVENCGDEGYGFWLDSVEASVLGWGLGVHDAPTYVNGNFDYQHASCNRYGLKLGADSAHDGRGYGRELIERLMTRGMLIDVDHMSRRSLADTLSLARARPGATTPYPLVAGHVQPFEIHHREHELLGQVGRHERMRTWQQLMELKADGGMIAVMTKDDVQDTDGANKKLSMALSSPRYGAAVPDDCRHSSKSFAQAYEYAVDVMGAPVALGTDFNGAAGHVGPRFGDRSCGTTHSEQMAQLQANSRMAYPFQVPGFGTFSPQRTGFKTFDYNVDGLAHVGLLPDLVNDLRTIGLGQTYIDALFRSAEWYVRVWERAVAVAQGQPPPSYDSHLSCDHVPLCLELTNKPPPITCPAMVVEECQDGGADVPYPDPSVGPDDCGDTSFSCGPPDPGSFFALGTTTVGCTASDVFAATSSCSFSVQVRDTLAPQPTAPDDVGGIECESHAGTAVALGMATALDSCEDNVSIGSDAPARFPYGNTTVTWRATDSSGNAGYAAQNVQVVDTRPPSIVCPERLTAECTGGHTALASPGSASGSDICDANLDFTRYDTQVFPLGDTSLPYTAVDDAGLGATCVGVVSIVDTTPPQIRSVLPSRATLGPPNHEMIGVTVTVDAVDVCDAGIRAPRCAITDIESSEPEDERGDGNTWFDWEITGALTANLRAERSGRGPGRTYLLEVTCSDLVGLSSSATTSVFVAR